MARFLEATVSDIKGGRESWRVLVTFAVPSFLLGMALVFAGRLH